MQQNLLLVRIQGQVSLGLKVSSFIYSSGAWRLKDGRERLESGLEDFAFDFLTRKSHCPFYPVPTMAINKISNTILSSA